MPPSESSRRRCTRMLSVILVALAGIGTAKAQGLGYAIAGPAGISGFFGSSTSSVHAREAAKRSSADGQVLAEKSECSRALGVPS